MEARRLAISHRPIFGLGRCPWWCRTSRQEESPDRRGTWVEFTGNWFSRTFDENRKSADEDHTRNPLKAKELAPGEGSPLRGRVFSGSPPCEGGAGGVAERVQRRPGRTPLYPPFVRGDASAVPCAST